MSYQESYIPVGSLAQAAGIREALRIYDATHGCGIEFFCAARLRNTVLPNDGERYCAVVGGERTPWQMSGFDTRIVVVDLDRIISEDGQYEDEFEDVPTSMLCAAAERDLPAMMSMKFAMLDHLAQCHQYLEQSDALPRLVRPDSRPNLLGERDVRASYYSCTHYSPLGYLTLVGNGNELCCVVPEQNAGVNATALLKHRGCWYPSPSSQPFPEACAWYDAYFLGERPELPSFHLCLPESEVQRAICRQIQRIPYGTTMTMGEVAELTTAALKGRHVVAKSVASVVRNNPFPIIVPSHRVTKAGGVCVGEPVSCWAQAYLLAHEGADLTGLTFPGGLHMEDLPELSRSRDSLSRLIRMVGSSLNLDDLGRSA